MIRVIVSLFLAVIIESAVSAEQRDPLPLASVRKVAVIAMLKTQDPLPPSLTENRLQTITELKLRTIGLRVLSKEEFREDPDVNPFVMVFVIIIHMKSKTGIDLGYVCLTRISVQEKRISPRNGAVAMLELWGNNDMLYTTPPEGVTSEVEKVLSDCLDEFANEWLKANPR